MNIVSSKLRLIFLTFALLLSHSTILLAQHYTELGLQKGRVNVEIGYEMLGYENNARRFWVVISPSTTKSQKTLNRIISDIYLHHKAEFNLDNVDWNISFFSNKAEAGYKTFKTDSYLAEYKSCDSPDEHYRNKVYIYPTNAQRVKWYYGPSGFKCSHK
jgi:hypothetical protein